MPRVRAARSRRSCRSVVVLPEPGRAEQREELAFRDVDVDVGDGDDLAVGLPDAEPTSISRRRPTERRVSSAKRARRQALLQELEPAVELRRP